jgi:hypothetical protein
MILHCKKIIVSKSKEAKPGCNQAEISKKNYGPKNCCRANNNDYDFIYFSYKYSIHISDCVTSNNMIN